MYFKKSCGHHFASPLNTSECPSLHKVQKQFTFFKAKYIYYVHVMKCINLKAHHQMCFCIHVYTPNLCQSRQRTLLSAQKLHTPSQSSPQPLRDNHGCAFVHPQVIFSSVSCKWNPVCTLLCKATCTWHNVFEIHFMVHRHFIFYCLVVIHGASQFVYPFSFQWLHDSLCLGLLGIELL